MMELNCAYVNVVVVFIREQQYCPSSWADVWSRGPSSAVCSSTKEKTISLFWLKQCPYGVRTAIGILKLKACIFQISTNHRVCFIVYMILLVAVFHAIAMSIGRFQPSWSFSVEIGNVMELQRGILTRSSKPWSHFFWSSIGHKYGITFWLE